jgi:hypothetical protein
LRSKGLAVVLPGRWSARRRPGGAVM